MSMNRVVSQFRQLVRTPAADVLPNGQTFASLIVPDPLRIIDCLQSTQVVVSIETAGNCIIVPFWKASTVETDLGWFRDNAQVLTINGATRELRTLDVRAGMLLLWVESIATGQVTLHAATLRTT